MKISIITLHDIGNNFGSTLQGCALCEFLRQNHYDAEIINYLPDYRSAAGKMRALLTNGVFLPFYLQRKRNFGRYYREHAVLSRRYRTFAQLKENPPKADVYLVGSDQVWNPHFPCGRDKAFYLEFLSSGEKMAYSASLGRLQTQEEITALIERLRPFRAVAVRERASMEQLHTAGRKDVRYVLDPVFLFPADYYQQHITPKPSKRFLLVYAINKDPVLEEAALRVAKDHDLEIISIGGFSRKCRQGHFLRSAGPIEFLNLIAHSDFFLTSSFHGTALALILNKQFAVVQPRINSLRVENLLQTAGIMEQAISSPADISRIHPIDYSLVNQKLAPLIDASKHFLLETLEQCQRKYKC